MKENLKLIGFLILISILLTDFFFRGKQFLKERDAKFLKTAYDQAIFNIQNEAIKSKQIIFNVKGEDKKNKQIIFERKESKKGE